MNDAAIPLLDRLRRFDESRPSVPGEHWLACGVGIYFLLRGRRRVAGRLASMAVGVALVARGLSGRDGAIAVLRRPEQRGAADASIPE